MTTQMLAVLAMAALALAVASFLLGYHAAETRERKAKKILDANLRLAIRQKNEMMKWVQTNWPNEYSAFHHGHTEGYQQGVLDSPKLEQFP